jgi:Na+(H+)/acetate symporter ActP
MKRLAITAAAALTALAALSHDAYAVVLENNLVPSSTRIRAA